MTEERIKHWISMSDPKYLPIMVFPFIVSYVQEGRYSWALLAAGCAAVVILNTTAVVINMYCDRPADEVNFPSGVAATEKYIGYRRLFSLSLLLILLLLIATVAIWWVVS